MWHLSTQTKARTHLVVHALDIVHRHLRERARDVIEPKLIHIDEVVLFKYRASSYVWARLLERCSGDF
jgi:hypothetical protein